MKIVGLSTKSFRVAGPGLAFAVLTGSVWAQEQSATQENGKTSARYNIFDLGLVGNTLRSFGWHRYSVLIGPAMYGPPRDCKGKLIEKTGLRKCIRQ
jgi:hypothetical protein